MSKKSVPSQGEKFKQAAREAEADMTEADFKRSLKKVAQSNIKHASDCAVHNAPALEPGPCDCGATTPR